MGILINSQELENTTIQSDVTSISDATNELDVSIDRSSLTDPGVAISVQLFLSLDGGLSWLPWGGFGTIGGDIGVPKSGFVTAIQAGINRQIKTTLTVVGQCQTSLTVEER